MQRLKENSCLGSCVVRYLKISRRKRSNQNRMQDCGENRAFAQNWERFRMIQHPVRDMWSEGRQPRMNCCLLAWNLTRHMSYAHNSYYSQHTWDDLTCNKSLIMFYRNEELGLNMRSGGNILNVYCASKCTVNMRDWISQLYVFTLLAEWIDTGVGTKHATLPMG